jgi:GGDEF domain-containing protein
LAPPKPTRRTTEGEIEIRTIPSCIYVPLRMKNNTIGMLSVFDKLDGNVFTRMDQFLMMLLAEQAVVAIRNARMFKFAGEKAIKDPKTSLYSQYFFLEYLDREIERAKNLELAFCVGVFAIKELEEPDLRLSPGDWLKLKKDLARTARSVLRKTDILAGLKRNRFGFLLTDIPGDAVEKVVGRFSERLRETVQSQEVFADQQATIAMGLISREDAGSLDAGRVLDQALDICQKKIEEKKVTAGVS